MTSPALPSHPHQTRRQTLPHATAAAPFAGVFDWLLVVIAIAAFLALWKYKVAIMKVIGACAVAGLIHAFTKPLFS